MAVWHHPLFSSGPNGPNTFMRDMWRLLYDHDADVVVAAHDHLYERFGKQDVDGRSDARGLRQFIVGTGGARLYDFQRQEPNSQARIKSHGVLRLTVAPARLSVGVHRRDRRDARLRRRRVPLKARRSTLEQMIARRDKTRGLLIAFEGPDGSGKTTQRKLLKHLAPEPRTAGRVDAMGARRRWSSRCIRVRKRIRALSPLEYSLLHAIDFRHRVETEILPALWAGKTVLADRYLFAALARDAARGIELDWLLHAYAPLLWPDLVLYFADAAAGVEPARRGDAAGRASTSPVRT